MAIWQFRVFLIPENALLGKYDVLPLVVPQDVAENTDWWAAVQPPAGFEHQIDVILPERESWSTSMRMWGQEDGDDAYVCYVDASKGIVEEIAFRIDAGTISHELVHSICTLARQLNCVLMTGDREILAPDESMFLVALKHSTAKKYLDDPLLALQKFSKRKT